MENKKNNSIILVAAVIVVLVAIGALVYVLTTDKPTQSSASKSDEPQVSQPAADTKEVASSNKTASKTTITFTDDGFNPTSYTTTKGSTVTVKNESSMDVQFSSDDHPSHTDESEMNMDVLAAGESGTFTVTKAGTFGFHDHINDQYTGTLTVE